jgi:hypothetical protein
MKQVVKESRNLNVENRRSSCKTFDDQKNGWTGRVWQEAEAGRGRGRAAQARLEKRKTGRRRCSICRERERVNFCIIQEHGCSLISFFLCSISNTTVHVSNLPADVTSEGLATQFSSIGPVRNAFVVTDKESGLFFCPSSRSSSAQRR